MKKAIYFNSRLCICKTVTGVIDLEHAKKAIAGLCKMFGWKPEDVTEIKLV